MKTANFKIALFVLAGLLVAVAPIAARAQQPQALQITNGPVVEDVEATSAVIAWTTNTGGSTVVHYGTDQNNLSQTAKEAWTKGPDPSRTTHRVHVENLQPNTTYYFLVVSGEGSGTGTEAKSNIASFTTKSSGDSGGGQAKAPEPVHIIHGPVVEGVGPTSAVIAWTTNTGASTVVRYGTDQNNLSQTAKEAWTKGSDPSRTTHRVHVENLKPNTTYYFVVESGEASGTGTETKSNIASFTTKGQ
jgi:phosphodiesterase/alkaline phosphatase D-like protein